MPTLGATLYFSSTLPDTEVLRIGELTCDNQNEDSLEPHDPGPCFLPNWSCDGEFYLIEENSCYWCYQNTAGHCCHWTMDKFFCVDTQEYFFQGNTLTKEHEDTCHGFTCN